MKLINVRDRERKWFKGPVNLFDIGREKFEIEKFEIEKGYAVCLGEISKGTEHFVRDREIFEKEGSRDRESPQ